MTNMNVGVGTILLLINIIIKIQGIKNLFFIFIFHVCTYMYDLFVVCILLFVLFVYVLFVLLYVVV